LEKRAEVLETRENDHTRRDQQLKGQEETLQQKDQQLSLLIGDTRKQLEQAANMTCDEAKQRLTEQMVEEARHDAARRIIQIEEEAREEAERRAKKIISIAVERLSGEFVAERTASVIHLPSDDMKGRIIGREGRNIRAIEAATGVDIIIDETRCASLVSYSS
jgi:ribonuclease Y